MKHTNLVLFLFISLCAAATYNGSIQDGKMVITLLDLTADTTEIPILHKDDIVDGSKLYNLNEDIVILQFVENRGIALARVGTFQDAYVDVQDTPCTCNVAGTCTNPVLAHRAGTYSYYQLAGFSGVTSYPAIKGGVALDTKVTAMATSVYDDHMIVVSEDGASIHAVPKEYFSDAANSLGITASAFLSARSCEAPTAAVTVAGGGTTSQLSAFPATIPASDVDLSGPSITDADVKVTVTIALDAIHFTLQAVAVSPAYVGGTFIVTPLYLVSPATNSPPIVKVAVQDTAATFTTQISADSKITCTDGQTTARGGLLATASRTLHPDRHVYYEYSLPLGANAMTSCTLVLVKDGVESTVDVHMTATESAPAVTCWTYPSQPTASCDRPTVLETNPMVVECGPFFIDSPDETACQCDPHSVFTLNVLCPKTGDRLYCPAKETAAVTFVAGSSVDVGTLWTLALQQDRRIIIAVGAASGLLLVGLALVVVLFCAVSLAIFRRNRKRSSEMEQLKTFVKSCQQNSMVRLEAELSATHPQLDIKEDEAVGLFESLQSAFEQSQ